MGDYIRVYAEKKNGDNFEGLGLTPFNWQNYGMFGFLANVRNYSQVPCISLPRGLPENVSEEVKWYIEHEGDGAFSVSWLSVDELLNFDYNSQFEDRRCAKQIRPRFWDHGSTCEVGEGKMTTYRDFLSKEFFRDLLILKENQADRIVFWFF